MSHPGCLAGFLMDWDDPLFSDEEEFLFFIDGFDREETPSNPVPWTFDFATPPDPAPRDQGRKSSSGISRSPNGGFRC